MTLKKYLWWAIAVIVAILLGVGLYVYEDSLTRLASKHIADPAVVATDSAHLAGNVAAQVTTQGQQASLGGGTAQNELPLGTSGTGTPAVGAGTPMSGAGPTGAAGAPVSGTGPNGAAGATTSGTGPTGAAGAPVSGAGPNGAAGAPINPAPEIKIIPTNLLTPETIATIALPKSFNPQQFHPLLDESYRIVGGTLASKWLSRDEIAAHIKGGELFTVYSQSKRLGQVTSAKPGEEAQLVGETGHYVEMVKDKGFSGDCFSIVANWNPLPRLPRFDSTNVQKYLPLIQNRLYEKGLFTTLAQIKKVIYLDLEGDGIEEAFIVATNITADEVHHMANKNYRDPGNKYGLLILQKMIKGKEVNYVLYESFQSFIVYDISFFADIDGDGTMEFVASVQNLAGFLNDGFPLSVYDIFDIQKSKPVKITDTNPA